MVRRQPQNESKKHKPDTKTLFLVTYFHQVGPPLKGSMAFNIVPQDGDKTFKIKASEGLFRIVA